MTRSNIDDDWVHESITAYLSSASAPGHEGALDKLAIADPEHVYDAILAHVRLRTTHSSQDQDRLVGLLASLKARAAATDASPELYPLGLNIRELWNGELEENTVEQWTALNAFVARLAQAEISNFDPFGIWAMRAALEDEATTGGWIPAAAVWVLYAGRRMYALSREEGREWTRATRGGARWKDGPDGYSIGRWQLWKDGFRQIGDGSEAPVVADDKRELVKRAHKVMEELDRGVVKRMHAQTFAFLFYLCKYVTVVQRKVETSRKRNEPCHCHNTAFAGSTYHSTSALMATASIVHIRNHVPRRSETVHDTP
ncbi:hypothetical protein OF83DRAFT_284827 [Amylostereum chailletii]|nr:hypothetical protein OF83DRAFT_284827 [Amylostereum chailletii]